jgi:hypothetical protein
MMWKFVVDLAAVAKKVVQSQGVQYASVPVTVRPRVMVDLRAGIERSRQSLHSTATG